MKTITMKKQISLAISLSALAFFAACSDNVTDNDPVATQAYEDQKDFPDCDKDYEGMFATVKSEKGLYICTANKWVNLTTGATVSDDGDGKNTGCTSKELDDKSGVKVICNGDSVAVLKYGKTGSKGSTGPSGDTGEKGGDGKNGSNGSSGSDAKLDPSRCLVKYSGLDVMVYDCGNDSTYVRKGASKLSSTVWKGYSFESSYFYNGYIYTYYNDQFGSDATGSLVRFDGDDSWTTSSVSVSDIKRDEGTVRGTASVTVTKDVALSDDKYLPFVGVRFNMGNTNIKGYAGVCLTYSSDKEMALLVKGETGFVKATVPASKDEVSVKNLLWSDFTPVAKDADLEKVVGKASYIYLDAVDGDKAGTYTNTFSIGQFGFYGNCDTTTYADILAQLMERFAPSATGELVDSRQTPTVTYKTVTLGNQTWMAENLRYVTASSKCYYNSHVGDSDDDDLTTATAAVLDGADCSGNGRAYTWLDALGSAATTYGCAVDDYCTTALPAKVQGICPSGWHLPSISEWGELVNFLFTDYDDDYAYAGIALLAEYVEGEQYYTNGKNITGMNMKFFTDDELLWSTTEYEDDEAGARGFNYDGGAYTSDWDSGYEGYHGDKTYVYGVRCVKN